MNRYSRPQTGCDAAPVSRRSRYSDIGAAKRRHRWRSARSGEELPVPLARPALDQAMRSTGPPAWINKRILSSSSKIGSKAETEWPPAEEENPLEQTGQPTAGKSEQSAPEPRSYKAGELAEALPAQQL